MKVVLMTLSPHRVRSSSGGRPGSLLLLCVVVQFNKENGYEIQEVKLRVVFVPPPQPPSPVAESAEEGTLAPSPYPISAPARGLTPTDPVSDPSGVCGHSALLPPHTVVAVHSREGCRCQKNVPLRSLLRTCAPPPGTGLQPLRHMCIDAVLVSYAWHLMGACCCWFWGLHLNALPMQSQKDASEWKAKLTEVCWPFCWSRICWCLTVASRAWYSCLVARGGAQCFSWLFSKRALLEGWRHVQRSLHCHPDRQRRFQHALEVHLCCRYPVQSVCCWARPRPSCQWSQRSATTCREKTRCSRRSSHPTWSVPRDGHYVPWTML